MYNKEKSRKNYINNRDKLNEKAKKYYHDHKEERKKYLEQRKHDRGHKNKQKKYF